MPVLTRNIQETKFTLYGSGGTTSQECVVGMLTHISACVHICMFACFTHLETLPLITRATTYCREWGMEAHKCRFEQQSPKRTMREKQKKHYARTMRGHPQSVFESMRPASRAYSAHDLLPSAILGDTRAPLVHRKCLIFL